MSRITHPFPPLFDADSRVLILGSFPSVKSREERFFYGHPQNRFWRTLSALLGCPCPVTIPEKRAMLLGHHIALWDVIGACEISGSSDSSIRNVVPNDLGPIFSAAEIGAVFCNGGTSYQLYMKYQKKWMPAVRLPSTSPANAAWSPARLIEAWQPVADALSQDEACGTEQKG